ncbi:MAG: hypothetical protein V4574_01210 [Pseudomonadota bacterium]
MKFKSLVSIAAALSLVSISSAAVAQSAPQPATEVVKGDSEIKGSTAIVAILALAAVIGGTIIALKGKGHPTSP